MTFAAMQKRLLDRIRQLVERGEITETGLAELTGYSQPHVHNVLKGERGLSPEVADTLLHAFRLQVEDLLPERAAADGKDSAFREVRILKGHIAAGQPFPMEMSWSGTRVF